MKLWVPVMKVIRREILLHTAHHADVTDKGNPSPSTRRLRHNIVTQKPGFTMNSEKATTFFETLRLFVTDEMLDIICKHTNEEGYRVSAGRNEKWKDVGEDEFVPFGGLLVLCGVLKKGKEPLYEVWAVKSLYHRAVFLATTSRNGFFQILSCIRFDNKDTRYQPRADNKLGQIQRVFETSVASFKLT
jgi:hypothetical protein